MQVKGLTEKVRAGGSRFGDRTGRSGISTPLGVPVAIASRDSMLRLDNRKDLAVMAQSLQVANTISYPASQPKASGQINAAPISWMRTIATTTKTLGKTCY
jgi:hypothetical protein